MLFLLPFRTQGSSTAFIRPEYLLPPDLYQVYVQMRETALSPSTADENKDIEFSKERTKPLHLSPEVFETVSKKTWVDVLMQILKVRILAANWDKNPIPCVESGSRTGDTKILRTIGHTRSNETHARHQHRSHLE